MGADNTLSNEINVVISPQDLNQNDFEENYELGNMVHNNNTDKLLTIDDFATKDSHYRSGLGEKVLAALFINDAEHDKNTKYDNYEEGLPRRHSSESPFNDIDNDEINNNFVRKNRYSDSDNYNYLTNNLITDKVENDKESQDIKDNMHKRSNSDAGPGFIGSLDLNNPIPTSLLSKGGFFSRDSPIFQVLEKENEKQKQKDKENEIKKKTELLQPSESPPSSPPPSPPPPPPPPPPAPMNPINSPNHISNPTISQNNANALIPMGPPGGFMSSAIQNGFNPNNPMRSMGNAGGPHASESGAFIPPHIKPYLDSLNQKNRQEPPPPQYRQRSHPPPDRDEDFQLDSGYEKNMRRRPSYRNSEQDRRSDPRNPYRNPSFFTERNRERNMQDRHAGRPPYPSYYRANENAVSNTNPNTYVKKIMPPFYFEEQNGVPPFVNHGERYPPPPNQRYNMMPPKSQIMGPQYVPSLYNSNQRPVGFRAPPPQNDGTNYQFNPMFPSEYSPSHSVNEEEEHWKNKADPWAQENGHTRNIDVMKERKMRDRMNKERRNRRRKKVMRWNDRHNTRKVNQDHKDWQMIKKDYQSGEDDGLNDISNNVDDQTLAARFKTFKIPILPKKTLRSNSKIPNKIADIKVQCDIYDESMAILLTFLKPFKGVVYSKGYYKSEFCRVNGNHENQVSIRLPLDGCGTVQENEIKQLENGVLSFHNTVIIMFSSKNGVLEGKDKAFHVTCEIDTTGVKRVNGGLDVTVPYSNFSTRSDIIPKTRMSIIPGRDPFSKPENLFELGSSGVLDVTFKDRKGLFDLYLFDCYAHDGMGNEKIRLIDENGCPENENLIGAQSRSERVLDKMSEREDYDTFEKHVYAPFNVFKFPDVPNVYFDCYVQICYKECPKPVCSIDRYTAGDDNDNEEEERMSPNESRIGNHHPDIQGDYMEDMPRETSRNSDDDESEKEKITREEEELGREIDRIRKRPFDIPRDSFHERLPLVVSRDRKDRKERSFANNKVKEGGVKVTSKLFKRQITTYLVKNDSDSKNGSGNMGKTVNLFSSIAVMIPGDKNTLSEDGIYFAKVPTTTVSSSWCFSPNNFMAVIIASTLLVILMITGMIYTYHNTHIREKSHSINKHLFRGYNRKCQELAEDKF
ncbi:unnamed protein product [Gordionus sp. m RMFG-2023]